MSKNNQKSQIKTADAVAPEVAQAADTVAPEVAQAADTVAPEVAQAADTVAPEVAQAAQEQTPIPRKGIKEFHDEMMFESEQRAAAFLKAKEESEDSNVVTRRK